jgi:hypothetical protein
MGLSITVRASPLQQLYRCAINRFDPTVIVLTNGVGKARCQARLYNIETLQTMSFIKDPGFKPVFIFSRFAMLACRWRGLSGVFRKVDFQMKWAAFGTIVSVVEFM